VLLIPEQALIPDSKVPYVYRVVEGKAKRTPVKTGLRRDAQIEVVEGLSAGDEVVTAGQMKLRDGAAVRAAGEGAAVAAGSRAGQASSVPAAGAGGQGK
jgi:membrane fusion protein (multidrug efflux system)